MLFRDNTSAKFKIKSNLMGCHAIYCGVARTGLYIDIYVWKGSKHIILNKNLIGWHT